MQRLMQASQLFILLYTVLCSEADDGAPYLHVMARSSVYNVGEKKAIYCKGRHLTQRIEWYSPSEALVEGRSVRNTRVFVERPKNESLETSLVPLIIQSTQIRDSGNWTCQAGDLRETIEIVVGEKVNIPVRFETVESEEGKSVRLECVARGSPAPVVQWYKDITPITEDPKKYIVRKKEDNYQLEIRNLSHADSGEYVCKVTQEAISYYTDKRVQLAVQHKPFIVNPYSQEIYAVKYKVEDIYAILNETKNVSCNILAYPAPTYRWYRRENSREELIRETDTIFTAEDGSASVLMLRMYDETDLGEYKCAADNGRGHAAVLFHVSLGNKPDPPDHVSLVSANVSELVFNVSCSSCNMMQEEGVAPRPDNLPLLGYSFQFTPVREGYPAPDWDEAIEILVDIEDPEDTIFVVGPLPNSTKFHAQVRSRNSAGFSEWTAISPDPATTDAAVRLLASICTILIILLTLYHMY